MIHFPYIGLDFKNFMLNPLLLQRATRDIILPKEEKIVKDFLAADILFAHVSQCLSQECRLTFSKLLCELDLLTAPGDGTRLQAHVSVFA